MKGYMGKGERAAYDARLNAELERMYKELNYYPSLRQITERLNDGSSITTVYTALKRMIKNGELTKTAVKNYGVKQNERAKSKDNKQIKKA